MGAHRPEPDVRYPFVADIVGNTICADLMDYLRRDHHACGLPIGLGHRFMNGFYVMDASHVHFPRKMVVQVSRDGQRRVDVLSELVKYLRYPYELSERVLVHHAKTAADVMISKMLQMWADELFAAHAQVALGEGRLRATVLKDIDLVRQRVAATDTTVVTDRDGRDVSRAELAVDTKVREDVETVFRTGSDDSILERLAEGRLNVSLPPRGPGAPPPGATEAAAATSPRHPRGRHCRAGHRPAEQVPLQDCRSRRREGRPIPRRPHLQGVRPGARRREIEQGAMRFAGLTPAWHLVLWVPEPWMRMKVAQVLCDDDGHVAPLSAIGDNKSDAVLEQHKRLWSLLVYAHPDVRHPEFRSDDPDEQARLRRRLDAALAYLRDRMDLDLRRWDGKPVPSRRDFVIERVAEHLNLPREQKEQLAAKDDHALSALGTVPGDQRVADQEFPRLFAVALSMGLGGTAQEESTIDWWR